MPQASKYTIELAKTICDRIADGQSLRAICDEDGMPAKSTVMIWLAEQTDFQRLYAVARDLQADSLFDDILLISDDGRNDWMQARGEGDQGPGWRENGEALRRSQLRIDARKWMASKLKPKKYGDKLDLNHSGQIATPPIDLKNISLDTQKQLLAILEKATAEAEGE